MSIKTVQQYVATDGKTFDDPTKAEQHQAVLDVMPQIDEFVSAIANERHRARTKNLLVGYHTFLVTGTNPNTVTSQPTI